MAVKKTAGVAPYLIIRACTLLAPLPKLQIALPSPVTTPKAPFILAILLASCYCFGDKVGVEPNWKTCHKIIKRAQNRVKLQT